MTHIDFGVTMSKVKVRGHMCHLTFLVYLLLLLFFPEETKNPVLDENHVRALGILTFSDNTELQKSAALCYSEISDKSKILTSLKV